MTVSTEFMSAPRTAPRTTQPRSTSGVLLLVIVSMLSAVGGVISALGVLDGNKAEIVVPLAAAVAVVAAALAFTRFGVFVMLMLALRASVDVTKLTASSQSASNTEQLSNRLLTPSTLLVGLFMVAAGLWLIAQARAGSLHRGDTQRRAWFLFAAVGFVSLIASADRTRTLVGAAQVLSIALMYVALEELMADVRTRNRLLTAVYLSALGPLLFTIAGFVLGSPAAQVKGGFVRIAGTFSQTNDYGRYLMLLILFGIAIYRHVPKRWRTWFGILLGVCGIFMLLTYTLTAIVGAFLGLLIVGIWNSKRVLAGLVVACICAFVVAPQLLQRIESVTTAPSYYSTNYHTNSLVWRLSYWHEVLPLANADPITGIGLYMTSQMTDQSKQPHNDFLRAYVEEGVLGEIAYLVLLASMIALGIRATRASPRGTLDRSIGVGYLACASAIVASSAASNVFTSVVVLWYLVPFAAAASNVLQRRSPTPAGQIEAGASSPVLAGETSR